MEQIDKRYFSLMRTPGMRSHGDSKLMADLKKKMAVAKVMADAKVKSILGDLDNEIDERYYSIRTNEKLELTVNPYPRNREDIED